MSLLRYGGVRYDAWYAAAVAVGKKRREVDVTINRQTVSDLRAQLQVRDQAAHLKEQEHVEDLAAAQRRVRDGSTTSLSSASKPVGQ